MTPYSIREFRQLLEEYSEASASEIERKLHSRYFEEYFGEMGVKTIVVEEDYLDNVAAYYVRCSVSPHMHTPALLLQ